MRERDETLKLIMTSINPNNPVKGAEFIAIAEILLDIRDLLQANQESAK